ncbi:MAG TPA: TonB-dependent receptor, partial [Bacteroidetes bacterium]|nr:TonB-dependent receptor [Bacteroidota bacterium]
MAYRRFLLPAALFLLLVFSAAAFAADHRIEGTVTDSQTGQPLVGANIFLEGTTIGTTSDANGHYVLTGVPAGRYTLTVSYLGYRLEKRTVVVSAPTLTVNFALTPVVLPGQEVIVTATRAKFRETPVPFTNISRGELQQRYWAQDIPMLIATAPSVYAYSDAGNGIGYSYLKIRGFDQRRVNVMLNGIPLNDPEDHNVYWVDMPDFAASVQDIQIQRGAGTSIYGSSSFGGSVNIVTSELTSERGLKIVSGAGSYDTRKFTAQFNSGLVNNTYALTARYSRVLSDGYRERSNVDLWSYFLSAARYTANTTTQINIYGGQEITHAAWDGSPEDVLKVNHRDNPITYPNTID